MDNVQEIKAYSHQGLCELMTSLKCPVFRAKQIESWLYQKHVASYDDMTNLPKTLREQLQEAAPLYPADVIDKQVSSDGTRKYIVQFHDGAKVEMVAMPTEGRLTVCASTQVGCPMACSFCATGKEGFMRNLLPGEILDQLLLAQDDMNMRVSNVVLMGQGEPFLNYDNVLAAMRYMNSSNALGIGARHITVSTCGLIEGIERLGHESEQFTLAVSLHSALQSTRDEIMPRVANQNLESLKAALQNYQQSSGRRVSIEYLLIKGFNDDQAHLDALIEFCGGLQAYVNLLPLNDIPSSPFKPVSKKTVNWFIQELSQAGIEAALRNSRGSDISAACGQLKNELGY